MRSRGARVLLSAAVVAASLAAAIAACFPDYAVGLAADSGADGAGDDASLVDHTTSGDDGPAGDGDAGTTATDSGSSGGDSAADLDGMAVIAPSTFHFQATDFDMSTDASTVVDASATLDYKLAIDKYEVTVARFQKWVQAKMPVPADNTPLDPNYPTMVWDPSWTALAQDLDYADAGTCNLEGNSVQPTYLLVDGGDGGDPNFPMNCVNWMQALAFCWWDGHKRLPTDTEWRIVATSEGRELDYPWGNATPDCAHTMSSDSPYPGPQACNFPVPVGTADAGATRDGVYDIVGSLSEWLWDYLGTGSAYVYPANAGTDYAGPDAASAQHQWFGGDFTTYPTTMTSIQPGATYGDPQFGYASNGWRCAKSLQ